MAVREGATDLPGRRAVIDMGSGIPEFARGALPRLDPLDPASAQLVKGHTELADDILQDRLVAATHFSASLTRIVEDPAFDIGTTTTAVVRSTVSWSPSQTSPAATAALVTNASTKTRSLKVRSR